MKIEIKNIEIPIEIEKLLSIDLDKLTEVLGNIAESARVNWMNLADTELATTKRAYQAGISESVDLQPGIATISLVGALPNVIENGMAETDLRDLFLKGGKVKTAKSGGKYKHIFFRMLLSSMPPSVAKKARKMIPGLKMSGELSKGSIYEGMTKKSGGAGYGTYRTISENVKDGWIRPETTGKDLASEVQSFIVNMVPEAIDEFLKGMEEK